MAEKAEASVDGDTVSVNWSDESQREHWVDELAPKLADQIRSSSDDMGSSAGSSTSDTSYLNGADAALTRPFMKGFNDSARTIYWVGLGVILAAFVLSWFFRVPPLSQRSGLQSQADDAASAETRAAEGGRTEGGGTQA